MAGETYSTQDVDRIVEKRLKEQAEAIKVAGIDKALARVSRELATFRRETSKRLDDNNHLRETLASKEDLDVALAPIKAKLASIVVVQQLGDGDYAVTLGDVTLGPEDLDELPQVTKASRAAREAAASAKEAAVSATQASSLKSMWVTAIAAAASAFIAILVAIGGFAWWLHQRGLI